MTQNEQLKEIGIKLKAKNSSGEQTLSLVKDDGVFFWTLYGMHNDHYLQIDFDEVKRSDLEDMRATIDLLLE